MNIRLTLLAIAVSGAFTCVRADDNDAKFMWEADFTMSFHSYGGHFNADVTVLPWQWLGATAGIGVATDCGGVANFLKIAAASAVKGDIEFEYSAAEASFTMHFAPVVQSMPLWTSRTGDSRLTLRVEPGILLAFPADRRMTIDGVRYRNQGGRFAFWHGKAGVALQVYRVNMMAGYVITDYDLYACYRNIRVAGRKYFGPLAARHGFYISMGYKF